MVNRLFIALCCDVCIISHWDIYASTFCIYFAKDGDIIDFIVNLFC
ncbi:hypothetical protein GCWU000324_01054 [Kingella oralis ATCC 51147]|uniref:Uncharacterized protein n=1 Tax=Kingella oralis ATCC 51147 TaxID=629741 RepID=C4GFY7_9NEIS|nr:hypothetical protein GCWU000324_01054 [Kingella oralis ATCC 51147]